MLGVKEAAEASTAARVRSAFATGVSDDGARLFLEAREAGLGWEAATRAVAEGLDEHYGIGTELRVQRLQHSRMAVLLFTSLRLDVGLRLLLGVGHRLLDSLLGAGQPKP